MNKTGIYIITVSICCFIKITGQTSNSGEFIITPNTIVSTVANFNNTTAGNFINDGTLYVYSDFNNDGLISFSPISQGLTYFKGNQIAQTISGNTLSELNNVRFENNSVQPAFLLSGPISVAGVSDFFYGIVDNVNYPGSFVFEGQASHKSTSNNSYVAGYVERNQNNEFEFPIGDGGFFRPSAIGSTNALTNFFRSRYFLKNSNALHPHNQKDPVIQIIDANEYWEFDSSQSPVDVALTLSWNEDTTPDEVIDGDPNTELAIVRWDETENKWKYFATAVDVSNKIATAGINNDGTFTLARVLSDNISDDVVVHNGISANDDGKNDYLVIDGLEKYPDNKLEIYNRWGVKVFETIGYGVNGNFFYGYSNGRATVKKSDILPTGTYFYILTYKINDSKQHDEAGYIYLN
ncbi:gliding motility-associated C-terminal domain-containing protein [Flavobacterium olei]|uniref:gliding motility-associated C-terminal domain-containing protein n=1 Tax=Flavobacterium olei TaxID=1886782 RepID=UPI00321B4C2D